MSAPDEEAARAADDAALAAAEALTKYPYPGDLGFRLAALDALSKAVAIARRLQIENRELREKLERVRKLKRYEKISHIPVGAGYFSRVEYEYVKVTDLESAIADAEKVSR